MSSVFSHESAQRNDAGHLIDKNVFKTTPFILSSMKRTTVVRFMLDNMNGLLAFAWRMETWNHW